MLSEELLDNRRPSHSTGSRTQTASLNNDEAQKQLRTRIVTSEVRELARLRSEETQIPLAKKRTGLAIGLGIGFAIVLCTWLLMPGPESSPYEAAVKPGPAPAVNQQEAQPIIIAPAAPKKAVPKKTPRKRKKRSRRRGR